MSCPPKFADLHKSADDAFTKDYLSGVFNHKMTQNYEMGNYGKGTMTAKLNYAAGITGSEVEFKHKYGDILGGRLSGVAVTKTVSDKNGVVKTKVESPCGAGKVTWAYDFDLSNWKIANNAITIDHGKNKLTNVLKVCPDDGFMGAKNASLASVFAVDSAHNFGVSLCYDIKKGALCHDIKAVRKADGMTAAFGVKNANDISMLISKALPADKCSMKLGAISFSPSNFHVKTDYAMKGGNWNTQICVEGSSAIGSLVTDATKFVYNVRTGDYAEHNKFSINDKLSCIVGAKSNTKGFFNNLRLGASLNFSV